MAGGKQIKQVYSIKWALDMKPTGMGCENTKVASVVEEAEEEPEESDSPFTEVQIDMIRSTWPVVSRNMEAIGTSVFLRIFEMAPYIKDMFPFRNLSGKELLKDPVFRSHSMKFMEVVDLLVRNVESLETDVDMSLLSLGAKHATFKDFGIEYFTIYSNALLSVWEFTLGEEYSPEIHDSWHAVFEYIRLALTHGYESVVHVNKYGTNGE